MTFHVPERYRVLVGKLASNRDYGNNGVFVINFKKYSSSKVLNVRVIASDGDGWEHVSVSIKGRIPPWDLMCAVKNLFWDKEDCVVQYHPPESEYVNDHPFVLHLWRPIGKEFPRPPKYMV